MGLEIDFGKDQTPLDDNEIEGLLIPTITTHAELNEFEQQNIEEAIQWVLSKGVRTKNILTEKFVKTLHKRMYGDVWKWAGEFRKTNKNFGVDRFQIPVALGTLLDDTIYWVENKTFSHDEIAIRFKHRIVSIHCFSNGNGRHSRLMGDIIATKIFNKPLFSWGANTLMGNMTRANYIKSIREADKGNYNALLKFARS